MHLIVGLGNPGPKYETNRHNIGFLVVDRIADQLNAPSFREKFKGLSSKASKGSNDIVLLKPQTFMNLSGESVRKAMDFYKVPIEQVIVIHDELDLAEGDIRLKVGGGAAGHNGLKSIVQHATNAFVRVRYGIGRPVHGSPANFVLSDFSSEEQISLSDHIERAATMALAVPQLGAGAAMNRYNRR